jgi:hypothetical protein
MFLVHIAYALVLDFRGLLLLIYGREMRKYRVPETVLSDSRIHIAFVQPKAV